MIRLLGQFKLPIVLDAHQLISLGLHLGHTLQNTDFLAMWMVYGNYTRKVRNSNMLYSFFLLNMSLTKVGLNSLLNMSEYAGGWNTVWYACHDTRFKGIVARYALMVGEVASISLWVSGTLTNYKSVMIYTYMVLIYLKAGYRLNHKHKKRALKVYGVCFTKLALPLFIFFYKMLSMPVAIQEAISAKVAAFGVLDSDNRGGIKTAIISNDDSLLAVNFFMYFFTKKVYINKLLVIWKWRTSIRRTDVRKSLWVFWFYIFYYMSINVKEASLQLNNTIQFVLNKLNYLKVQNRITAHWELSYLFEDKRGGTSIDLSKDLVKNNYFEFLRKNPVDSETVSDSKMRYEYYWDKWDNYQNLAKFNFWKEKGPAIY